MNLLRELGVPESNVIKSLQFYPQTLTKNPTRFRTIVGELKEMGFDPLKAQFTVALHVWLCSRKSSWAKKVDVYKKWGWSDTDVLEAFRKYPLCMTKSEDKIEAVMEFLVLKLGCDSSTINKYPSVFGLSLKKRIVPRGAVIQVLQSKGVVKKKTLLAIFIYTEKVFLRRFVPRHGQEASELLELYRAILDLTR